MKNYRLIHETPNHFVLHNGIAHFHVAKKGIDEPTMDKIRALADGGEVKDTDLENPPEANLDDIYKAQPLPTPEPQSKRREIESEMPEPEGHAHGGKLTAEQRNNMPQKEFALPGGRYPINDANHARNALARVSQHGSPEEKARVLSKVASKYPGIEQSKAAGGKIEHDPKNLQGLKKSFDKFVDEEGREKYDEGGQVQSPPIDPDKAQSAQDSMRKAFGYDDGGQVQPPEKSTLEQVGDAIKNAFEGPSPTPAPTPEDREAQYEKTRAQNRSNMGYAGGGPVASNAVKDISHETQAQAIGRYAAGNPANLDKGGGVQNHFHFYQGGMPTMHSDKQPDAPPTPLDVETRTHMADGGQPSSVNVSAEDLDPNAVINPGYNAPTDLQKEIDAASQDQPAPSPEQSANNLAGAMGQSAPFQGQDQAAAASPAPGAGPVVAPQNQVSMAPKSLPPTPGQNVDLLSEFNKNLQGEQEAIRQGAVDTAQGFQAQNDILKKHLAQEEQSFQTYQQDQAQNTAQANELFKRVANNQIDPNRYWENKSTGGKIAAAIGLILGGASSGLTGRSNPALDIIQNSIREDIAAQRDNQTTNMNLYKMGLQKYKDRQAAEDYAQLHSNTIAQGMLQVAANKAAIPAAANNAKLAINQLGLQNIQLRTNLGMQQAALNAMNTPSPKGGIDLNKLNLLKQSGIIPKEDVPDLNKEAADYQKLSDTLDHTDDVFKQGRQNQTYTERALPGWTPTIRDQSKNYEAITNAWLGNITKETEGRVTPVDVDLMRSSLPKAGDSPEVFQTKLNSVKDMIRQKYAFPNLIQKRIISPNDSVAVPSATRKKRFNESPVK
jgi:hypothetical protein